MKICPMFMFNVCSDDINCLGLLSICYVALRTLLILWSPSWFVIIGVVTLQWRHNEHGGVPIHQPHDCLLNRLFKEQSKENIKAPRDWPLCGEFTGDHIMYSPLKGNPSHWVINYMCFIGRPRMFNVTKTWAPSQYKDRLIYVWRFPC